MIPQLRLASQQLAASVCQSPADVVRALGAVQAQDYGNSLWAIGCRIPESTLASVEQAIADRTIVRTWPMRGTLHFIPAADVRWMLPLLTPRVVAGAAARSRQFELTEPIFQQAEKTLVRAMQGQPPRTREATMEVLEAAGISTVAHRGMHIVTRLAMQGLICCGPREGKQPTFVLLDEWVPTQGSRSLDRETALATLARRFFGGHGPATLQDFVWWSGLKVTDARNAVAMAEAELERHHEDGFEYWHAPGLAASDDGPAAHFLPGFDEYLLGYKDRRHVLDVAHAGKVVPGANGMFLPMMVRRGRVVGTWKRLAVTKAGSRVALGPFAPRLTKTELREFKGAAERYGQFLGTKVGIVAAG